MKTKLTPEIQEKIIGYIKAGNYIATACKAVGIYKSTYYRWVQRGTKALWLEEKGEKVLESEEIYYNFCNSIKKAKAKAEMQSVSLIRIAGIDNWQAAAWWLERTNWKKWGKKDKLEVKTKKTVESKQVIEFRTKEKELTVNTRKQLVEFTMKAIEEYSGSNGNNGNS